LSVVEFHDEALFAGRGKAPPPLPPALAVPPLPPALAVLVAVTVLPVDSSSPQAPKTAAPKTPTLNKA
jgi:hypothetical protein